MNKDRIIAELNEYQQKSLFKDLISKVYLHKDVLPVIEFTLDNRTFAFDVKPVDDKVELKLCWRNNSKQYSDFCSFKSLVSDSEFTTVLEEQAQKAVDFVKKNGQKLVSVVVPVFNRESCIARLIDSLKQQTLEKEKFEVIFIDDCSTDGTIQQIEANIGELNYRIISTPFNSGAASLPRNFGIKSAFTDYVFFADSDDYLAPETLKTATDCAVKNANDIVYLNYESTAPEKRASLSRTFKGQDIVSKADVFRHFLLLSLTPYKLFNTIFLKSNNLFFDTELTNTSEQLFVTSCLAKTNNVAVLRSQAFYFLTTDEGLTHQYTDKPSDDMIYKLWSESLINILKVDDYIKRAKLFNSLYYRFAAKYHSVIRANKNKSLVKVLSKIVGLFENNASLFDETLIFRNGLDNVVFVRNYFLNSGKLNVSDNSSVEKQADNLIQSSDVLQDNRIVIFNDSGKSRIVESIPNLSVKFTGNTALVKIHESVAFKGSSSIVLGDKSAVLIDKKTTVESMSVELKSKSVSLCIGKKCTVNGAVFKAKDADDVEIIVGDGCYLDKGSKFVASVPYSIIDKVSNKILNATKFGIHIDESVYIGAGSIVSEDVVIPANCLVKPNSVVYSSRFVSGSLLAGNPAQVVRTGVYWKKENPEKLNNKIF